MDSKKILVISPKGGCGKSTLCFQILAPYIFDRTKKIPIIYDLDNANSETETYSKSTILKAEKKSLSDVSPNFFTQPETIIFDTGTTTLAKKVLDDFSEKRILKHIDLFMIPLTRGEQSADSAFNMYKAIKGENKNAKICFVLSNVYDDETPLDVQFLTFLGDKRNNAYVKEDESEFDPEKGLFDECEDATYLAIPECSSFSWGQIFGKTVYELADIVEDFDKQADELSLKINTPLDKKKYTLACNKFKLAKRCQRYRKDILEERVFKELDKILK